MSRAVPLLAPTLTEDGSVTVARYQKNYLYRVHRRGIMASFGHGGNAKEISRANKIDYDEILDFSAYRPGQVIDVFDGKAIVRTIDGSLLLDEYESGTPLIPGDQLN